MYRLAGRLYLTWLITVWGLLAVVMISIAACTSSAGLSAQTAPAGTPVATPNASEPKGRIAFVGDDGNLWLLELPSGQQQRLTEGEHVQSPAWSPNGVQLAYIRQAASNNEHEIVLLNTTTRVQHAVSALRDAMLARVGWSPDQHYLVGDIGCCATGRELVLLEPDGTQVRRKFHYSYHYTWSPNGRYLALGRVVPLEHPISVETGDSSSVVLLDVISDSERVVAQGTPEALYFPVCWLSEKILVYHQLLWNESDQVGQDRFWQVSIEGQLRPIELTANLPYDCDNSALVATLPAELQQGAGLASWSPDKQWVALPVTRDVHSSIYLVDMASHAVRRVASGTEPVWQPRIPQ